MAFKRNRYMTNNIMARGLSGTSTAIFSNDQYSRNKLLHFSKLTSFPVGNRPPNSFMIAQVNGGMSTRHPASSEFIANLAGGRNLEVDQVLELTTNNPVLDRIISLVLLDNCSISVDATLSAALLLLASSSGQLSSDVLLGAIFSVTAAANTSISYDAFLTALANLEAEAGGPTPLSPEGLANAVWAALAADNNEAGTMGQKLNTASSGGVDLDALAAAIWDKLAADCNNPDTIGEMINNISIELNKKLNTSTFIALK